MAAVLTRLGRVARCGDRGRPEGPLRARAKGAFLAVALLWALAVAGPARADWWEDLKDDVAYNYEQSKRAFNEGQWDLYVPFYIFHAPWAYSAARRAEENTMPWGAGIGRSVVDDWGRTQGLYALAYQDSHYKPMYILGYDWMTYWSIGGSRLESGLGYTLFLFSRSDIGNYWPLPGVLPLASLRYEKVEVMGTYVPGFGGGNGNVGFFFMRFGF